MWFYSLWLSSMKRIFSIIHKASKLHIVLISYEALILKKWHGRKHVREVRACALYISTANPHSAVLWRFRNFYVCRTKDTVGPTSYIIPWYRDAPWVVLFNKIHDCITHEFSHFITNADRFWKVSHRLWHYLLWSITEILPRLLYIYWSWLFIMRSKFHLPYYFSRDMNDFLLKLWLVA